jgi:putative membrane protein
MPISSDEKQQIATAIHRAEQSTNGEIVCVVARSSSNYGLIPLVWTAIATLAMPWPIISFTDLSVQRIYLAQLFFFIVVLVILMTPRVRMWLVPHSIARNRAHRAAMEQFMIRGMSHTADRTGVLIFTSMAERYARIIADVAVTAKVPQKVWDQAIAALLRHAAKGDVTTGMIDAIEICATTLAQCFPKDGTKTNQLPDRVYVI